VYEEDYARKNKEYADNKAVEEKEKFKLMLREAKEKKAAHSKDTSSVDNDTRSSSPEGTIMSAKPCKYRS
jgi:hypothetical protein